MFLIQPLKTGRCKEEKESTESLLWRKISILRKRGFYPGFNATRGRCVLLLSAM